jgi:hypothetical protein
MIPRAPDGHRNAGETIAANIAKLPELLLKSPLDN